MFLWGKERKTNHLVHPTHHVFDEKRTKRKVMLVDIVFMPEEY